MVLSLGSEEMSVGDFIGTGMHGGRIFIRTDKEPANLPSQVIAGMASNEEMQDIIPYISEFAGYFGFDAQALVKDRFYILKPNAKNPYKQLYTAN